MSSSNAFVSRRTFLRQFTLIGGAGLVLSGCGFAPVHRTTPGTASTRSELANVYIAEAPDRVTQVVRNELLFLFNQNASTSRSNASYELRVTSTGLTQGAIVTRTGVAEARIYTLNASYVLYDLAGEQKEDVLNGKTKSQASFDVFDQQYANLRAERDAENRAAADVARLINDRISTYFATRPL